MNTKGFVSSIKRFAVHDGSGIRTTFFLQGCPLSCPWCHNPESIAVIGDDRASLSMCSERSVSNVLDEVMKDKAYYDTSQGGVTVSGGEPTLQQDFLLAFLKESKGAGLHTVVDTSLYCPGNVLDSILPFTDIFLADLKIIDERKHQEICGVSNKRILKNLSYLCNEYPEKVKIRIPLIPGYTDDWENIKNIVDFINGGSQNRNIWAGFMCIASRKP